MQNPFPFSSPALGENFYGRREILTRIFEAAAAGGSLALFGPRHMGKTSLLAHAQTAPLQEELGLDPDKWVVYRVDCMHQTSQVQLVESTLQGIYDLLEKRGMHRARDLLTPLSPFKGTSTLTPLADLAQYLKGLGGGLLLCFDELNALFDLPESQILADLLALAAAGIGMVYTFEHSPERTAEEPAFRDAGKNRRFRRYHLNFFRLLTVSLHDVIQLGPLSAHNARQILENGFKQRNLALDPADGDLLLKIGGGHPFLLQGASSLGFQFIARADNGRLPPDFHQRLLPFVEGYFRTLWQGLSPRKQNILGALVAGQPVSDGALHELKGQFLITTDGKAPFSPLFGLFIAQKLELSDAVKAALIQAMRPAAQKAPGGLKKQPSTDAQGVGGGGKRKKAAQATWHSALGATLGQKSPTRGGSQAFETKQTGESTPESESAADNKPVKSRKRGPTRASPTRGVIRKRETSPAAGDDDAFEVDFGLHYGGGDLPPLDGDPAASEAVVDGPQTPVSRSQGLAFEDREVGELEDADTILDEDDDLQEAASNTGLAEALQDLPGGGGQGPSPARPAAPAKMAQTPKSPDVLAVATSMAVKSEDRAPSIDDGTLQDKGQRKYGGMGAHSANSDDDGDGRSADDGVERRGGFGSSAGAADSGGFGASAGTDLGGGFGASEGTDLGGGFGASAGIAEGGGYGTSAGIAEGGGYDSVDETAQAPFYDAGLETGDEAAQAPFYDAGLDAGDEVRAEVSSPAPMVAGQATPENPAATGDFPIEIPPMPGATPGGPSRAQNFALEEGSEVGAGQDGADFALDGPKSRVEAPTEKARSPFFDFGKRWILIAFITGAVILLNYAFLSQRSSTGNDEDSAPNTSLKDPAAQPKASEAPSSDASDASDGKTQGESAEPTLQSPERPPPRDSSQIRKDITTNAALPGPLRSPIPWFLIVLFPAMGYGVGLLLRQTKPEAQRVESQLDETQAQENLRRALEDPKYSTPLLAALLEMSAAITLDGMADALWSLESHRDGQSTRQTRGLSPDEERALELIHRIAKQAAQATQAPNGHARTTSLSRGLSLVERLEDQVDPMAPGILRDGFWLISRVWRRILVDALEGSAGRSRLQASMLTPEVRFGDEVEVVFKVRNSGDGQATGIKVSLINPIGADLIGEATQSVGLLSAQREVECTFTLAPHRREPLYLVINIMHWDPLRGDKTLQLNETLRFVDISKPHKPIRPIPYITGKPLEPGQIFVGRQGDLDFLSEALLDSLTPPSVMVIGHRRMGKTSLLRHIPTALGDDALCLHLDFQARPSDDGVDLMYWIAQMLAQQAPTPLALPPRAEFEANAPHALAQGVLAKLIAMAQSKRMVLLIDEMESLYDPVKAGRLSGRFFENMRSLLQRFPEVALVLAGTYTLAENSAQTSSMLFGSSLTREMGFLSRDDIATLLQKPLAPFNVEFAPLAFDRVHQLSGGHPLLSQHISYHLARRINRLEINFLSAEDVDGVVDAAIEGAFDHLHLWWNESTANQRWILAAIAGGKAEIQRVSEIQNRLTRWGHRPPLAQVRRVVIDLTKRELIGQRGDMDAFYYRQGLFRRWVHKNYGQQERRGRLEKWQR